MEKTFREQWHRTATRYCMLFLMITLISCNTTNGVAAKPTMTSTAMPTATPLPTATPSPTPIPLPTLKWQVHVPNLSVGMVEDQGMLLVNTEDSLVALSATDGTTIWKQPGRPTSTLLIENNIIYVALLANNHIGYYALDEHTGAIRSRFPSLPLDLYSFVALDHGIIFGIGEQNLFALRVSDEHMLWQSMVTGISGNLLLDNGTIYFANASGNYLAYDAATGHQQWSIPIITGQSVLFNTPVIANGIAYLITIVNIAGGWINSKNALYALRLSDHTLLWSQHINLGNAQLPPTIADGTVFIRGVDPADNFTLFAFDVLTGAVKWQIRSDLVTVNGVPVYDYTSVVVVNHLLYFGGGFYSRLYAVTIDGTPVWSYVPATSIPIYFAPLYDQGVLYLNNQNAIIALNVSS